MIADVNDILFHAEMSVRYHRRRATFLARSSSLMSTLLLVGGASAFASLYGNSTIVAKVTTLVLTAVGILQMVFRIDEAATKHHQWLKGWMSISRDIRSNPNAKSSQIKHWQDRICEIESECFSELRALQVDCFNRTAIALGRQSKPTPLKWRHRALIQIVSFEADFADLSEKEICGDP